MNEMTRAGVDTPNSHILVHRFDFARAASVEEASALLAGSEGRAAILAGGTDLLVRMKMERTAPELLVGIRGIAGLDEIRNQEGALYIGACASIRDVETHPWIQWRYAAVAEAAASFSTTQVQVMGTIGGNLANGSPASDLAPALIAHGAEVELAGCGGVRRIPLEEFFKGPGRTDLALGELMVGVVLPFLPDDTGREETADAFLSLSGAFRKISRVAADIAKASVAVTVRREGNRLLTCRIVCGAVAPVPLRVRHAEGLLEGQPFDEVLLGRAAEAAAQEVSPIDDVRSTAWYRREAVRALTYDALTAAWDRAGKSPAVASRFVGEGWSRAGEADPVAAGGGSELASPGAGVPERVGAEERRAVALRVNGQVHHVWVSPNDLLLNVLREQLQLTGTKYGCGIGECGACTVLMDGQPVLACLVLAVEAPGHEILTVEGLRKPDGVLDPLQEAFIEYAAFQCGYCTPGMLLTAKSLLAVEPRPTEDEVRHYLRGNLCRCTGYASIVRAVLSCAVEDSEAPHQRREAPVGGAHAARI